LLVSTEIATHNTETMIKLASQVASLEERKGGRKEGCEGDIDSGSPLFGEEE
jgi:hypothetical protein